MLILFLVIALRSILVKFDGRPIGLQVASKLVSVFDQNRRGSVDFSQYITMHKFIEHMRKVRPRID